MRHRSSRAFARLADAFWVFVLAIVGLFVFFAVLGAFSPGQVIGLTAVVAFLALLWIAHAVREARRPNPHNQAVTRARERRGF
jgi:uncharacterized membrane protein